MPTLSLLLFLPLCGIVLSAFSRGLGPYLDAISAPDALHALKLTAEAAAIPGPRPGIRRSCRLGPRAHEFPGRRALDSLSSTFPWPSPR